MAIDPTNTSFDLLLAQIEKLPLEVQAQLRDALADKLANGSHPTVSGEQALEAGWGKHLVLSVADDFDAPLEDFKEYSE